MLFGPLHDVDCSGGPSVPSFEVSSALGDGETRGPGTCGQPMEDTEAALERQLAGIF